MGGERKEGQKGGRKINKGREGKTNDKKTGVVAHTFNPQQRPEDFCE